MGGRAVVGVEDGVDAELVAKELGRELLALLLRLHTSNPQERPGADSGATALLLGELAERAGSPMPRRPCGDALRSRLRTRERIMTRWE
jgi:hypothetical protein